MFHVEQFRMLVFVIFVQNSEKSNFWEQFFGENIFYTGFFFVRNFNLKMFHVEHF